MYTPATHRTTQNAEFFLFAGNRDDTSSEYRKLEITNFGEVAYYAVDNERRNAARLRDCTDVATGNGVVHIARFYYDD